MLFHKSPFCVTPHKLVQKYQVLLLLSTHDDKVSKAVVVVKFLAFGASDFVFEHRYNNGRHTVSIRQLTNCLRNLSSEQHKQ